MENNKYKYQYIFALFFPFWSMIASVKFFKSLSARNLFWYGCAFMGFVFIFNPVGGSEADGTRYAQFLIEMHNQPVNFNNFIGNFYKEDMSLDIYQTLVTFVISLFTDNPHYLFLVFAIVFGFFYSRNIFMILDFSKSNKLNWWVWIVLLMFILIRPIWEINGVRMYTALHVFLYGLFSYLLQNNYKKLIWCFLAIFVHFSFVIPLIVLLIIIFIPKNNYSILFIIYFVAISFKELSIQALNDYLQGILPAQLSKKAGEYMNEEYILAVSELNSSYSQYIHIAGNMSRYFSHFVVLFLWINLKSFFQSVLHRKMLSYFLIYGAIFEILSVIPSMGRFMDIPNMIFYALLLVLLFDTSIKPNLHVSVKYLSILLILPVFFRLRIGTDYYGLSLFWGNFISAIFIDDNMPIIAFVKSFFKI